MSIVLGVLSRARVPQSRSNQVVVEGALALATAEGPLDRRAFHSEVISWCRAAAFAPCRPGTELTDATAHALFEREEELMERLLLLEGRAEFAMVAEQRSPETAGSGRAFLRDQARRLAAHACLREKLAETSAAWTPKGRVLEKQGILHASFLVAHEEIEALATLSEALTQAHGDTHVLHLSGPWPAYSFGPDNVRSNA